jgi:hypothetical protein
MFAERLPQKKKMFAERPMREPLDQGLESGRLDATSTSRLAAGDLIQGRRHPSPAMPSPPPVTSSDVAAMPPRRRPAM